MGSVLRCQLQKEAADMFLDRREGNHQVVGDLLIGRPLGKPVQHLLFALGEWFKELLCSLRGRAWQSFRDEGDGLLRHFLARLPCKRIEHGLSIGSKERRNSVLRRLEERLKCLVHRERHACILQARPR
jgi:hypothetical protein